MIHIEGEEDIYNDIDNETSKEENTPDKEEDVEAVEQNEESESDQEYKDEDQLQDAFAKGFLKDLLKVGPFSKQIMNYSYPPLLYQRGDDSEEDEGEGEEEEEDSQNSRQFAIDDDDVFNMDDLMGQDLDDLDQNNADLKQQEQVVDGLFQNE